MGIMNILYNPEGDEIINLHSSKSEVYKCSNFTYSIMIQNGNIMTNFKF